MTCTNPPIFISVVQLTNLPLQPPQKPLGVAAVNLQKLAPKNHELLPDRNFPPNFGSSHRDVNVFMCLFVFEGFIAHQKKSWGSACCWWNWLVKGLWLLAFPEELNALWEKWLMHQHEFVQDRMWYNRREGCYINIYRPAFSITINVVQSLRCESPWLQGTGMFQYI